MLSREILESMDRFVKKDGHAPARASQFLVYDWKLALLLNWYYFDSGIRGQ
jgi:hypothetical protein